jgi:hypothetical protein
MKYTIALLCAITALLTSCYEEPVSSTGVNRAQATVTKQSNGQTAEQVNIVRRVALENQPGSIKHLYVISAYSGEVLLYSTVQGKVTSSGKRLTPSDLRPEGNSSGEFLVATPGGRFYTKETLQDDGTYGQSGDYLYWFDAGGQYHQHYNAGGTFLHVSDKPTAFGRVIISTEQAGK